MKRALVRVVKLLLVAALMLYVFSKVHWNDRRVWRDGTEANEIVQEEPGTIEGPWDRDVVAFLPADANAPILVRRGERVDGGRVVDVEQGLRTYWRNVNGLLFALGALCYFVTVLIAGARWWWLLRVNGTDVTLGETLRYTWIGTFFNSVVPGATGGDLIKALYIMKRCPGHRVPVLVSVIVDRVLGLASLAILGAIVVLFALDRFEQVALAIWGVMLGVAALFAIAFSKRLRQLVRLKALLEKLPPRLSRVLKLVDQAVFFYRGHKKVIAASLVAGVGNHVISVLSVVLIGDALGVDMPWFEYFVMIPVINILSALPIAPNGWGWGEALYQHFFGTYGAPYAGNVGNAVQVMGTRGVALSVLYRLHLTLWSLLGGLFVLLEQDRVTKADIEQEVALEDRG